MSKGCKSYLTVMTLVVVIVGGYFAYRYASVYLDLDRALDHAFNQQSNSQTTPPGAYLIYSKSEMVGTESDISSKTTYYRLPLADPKQVSEIASNPIEEQALSSPNGQYHATWQREWDNHAARVNLQVYPTASGTVAPLVDKQLESVALGIAWGSPWPFAIDNSGTVYIKNDCGCDGRPTGLWKYEISRGLSKINYTTEHDLSDFVINGTTSQLISVHHAWNGPETDIGGGAASGPSEVHLIDLMSGQGRVILEATQLLSGAHLSPDGTLYAYTTQIGDIFVVPIDAEPTNAHVKISGTILDWVDDVLVIYRNEELILYNLTDDTVTALGRSIGRRYDPDWTTVRYFGILTIN